MKHLFQITVLFAFLFIVGIFSPFISEGVEGAQPLAVVDDDGKRVLLYEGSYALLIGVSQYTHGLQRLPGVMSDVKAVKRALELNGFHVDTVIDPDKTGLTDAFELFIKRYGGNLENRLLFYYAGHGYTIMPKFGGDALGYITTIDTPNPNKDPSEFKRVAMSLQRIEEYALNIDAKHAVFLFDSCFSGSIFSIGRAIPENITYKTGKPVRQFITAGNEDETVPDKSIFRRQFIAALEGEGDTNHDGYLTGAELGEFLQSTVVNYSKGSQHPQYGKIRNPNLDKGDYVFAVTNPNASHSGEGVKHTQESSSGSSRLSRGHLEEKQGQHLVDKAKKNPSNAGSMGFGAESSETFQEFEAAQEDMLSEFDQFSGPGQAKKRGEFKDGAKEIKERIKTKQGKGCDATCRRMKKEGVYIPSKPKVPKKRKRIKICKYLSAGCKKSRGETTPSDAAQGVNEIAERIKINQGKVGCDANCKRMKKANLYDDDVKPDISGSSDGSNEGNGKKSVGK